MKRLLLYTIVLSILSYAALKSLPAQGFDILIAEVKDGDIYVTDLDRNFYLPIVASPEDDFQPTWSPDGKWLAYTTFELQDNGWRTAKVMVTDILGRQHQFAGYAPGYHTDRTIRWSPDSHYVYVEWSTNANGRFIYDVERDNVIHIDDFQTTLESNANRDFQWTIQSEPVWSPDGENMAIYYYFPENLYQPETAFLFNAHSDGTEYEQIGVFHSQIFHVLWSHDKRWVALLHHQDENFFRHVPPDSYHNLTLVSADGRNARTVYRSLSYIRPVNWSPDNQYIYFIEPQPNPLSAHVNQTSKYSLYQLDVSTWELELISPLPETSYYPQTSFSPNGQYMVVQGDYEGNGSALINVESQSIQENIQGVNFQFSKNGEWLFFQKDWIWYRMRLDGTHFEQVAAVCMWCPRPFVEIEN